MINFDAYFPQGILVAKPIPLSFCTVLRPYLLERAGIQDGSVIMLAVPYAVPCQQHTVSCYAIAKDYHTYFFDLFASVLPQLRTDFPQYRFAGFSDHSPLAEVDAACRAGLGVLGDNGLLLTEAHSSFVFLGEIVTDMPTQNQALPLRRCQSCGACMRACPARSKGQICLSELTQKKGELDSQQKQYIAENAYVWGCDICQDVCPYTKQAARAGTLYTTIPYFTQDLIPCPDLATLENMTDEEFSLRAYAWRGRNTIYRNISIKENGQV